MKDKKGKIGFSHAIAGIIAVWKSEWNFRFHVSVMLFVLFFSFMFKLSLIEWGLIILVIGFVLVTEMINTVIERTIDYLKPEVHPTARFIKDAAAGVVLLTSIVAVIVGILIFLPKILNLF